MATKMNSRPVDADARELAIDPAQSFIVQAPAGSGKTELLIQRYLVLLATVNEPEEVVAITFTRKAAAEMQERILNALSLAASGAMPIDVHAQKTFQLATAVINRSQEYGWHIAENPGRLRIQTIDSLCASFTRQMPFLSQFGGQVNVVEDTTALYEEASINTLNTILSDDYYSPSFTQLLLHMDNNLPTLKNLLQHMLSKRDQWSRYIYAVNNRQGLEASIAILIEEKLQQLSVAFPQDMVAELLALLNYAAQQLNKDAGKIDLSACFDLQRLPGAEGKELLKWQCIANFLLTQSGTWRAQVNRNQGFPPATDNKDEAELRKEKKAAMKSLLQNLNEHGSVQRLLHDIRLLPEPHYSESDWAIVDALCHLLKIASAQLKLIFAETGETDFIGISEAAINALGSHEQPTDLALYLDYQINHVLIDEFQDISVNQFTLIKRMIAGWQPDDGHTLFLVGDPMQSIYGFREAEVGQYISTFHNESLADVRVKALTLKVNFRSGSNIVNWINDNFCKVLPTDDDIVTGAVSFSSSIAKHQDQLDKVTVHPFFSTQHGAEEQAAADVIGELKQQKTDDSIALLVRNRSHLHGILPLLREANIPYQAIEIDSLAEQQYIQDLLALTKAYLYPADRIAWLSLLRAPWCGFELDNLLTIASHNDGGIIWESCQELVASHGLDGITEQGLNKFVEIMSTALGNRQRYSLRYSIESIWCSLAGPATLKNRNELDNVETFFKLIETIDNAGRVDDIGVLDRKISQLYALPESHNDTNVVQVMTIHKAKGLEFDHVLLPQLGRTSRPRQPALLMWMLQADKTGHSHLLLSPIGQTGYSHTKLYDYLGAMEKLKERNEATRLLYVAATRAKKSLHLFGQAKLFETKDGERACKPQSGSLLAHLWPVLEKDFMAKIDQDKLLTDDSNLAYENAPVYRLTSGWQLPRLQQEINTISKLYDHPVLNTDLEIHFDWAGKTIKNIGTVVHICLAKLNYISAAKFSVDQELEVYIESSLRQLSVNAHELAAATQLVIAALENIYDDDTGRWIFSKEHLDAKNEYALSGLIQGRVINVVIDRTFIDKEGTRWIIDYKISRHEGEDRDHFLEHELARYKNKMELYAQIISAMEQRTTMLGLYFPLLKGWRCWTFSRL